MSVLESESLEGHEADASLASQSKPQLDLGSWQTNLLFAGLKSLALQSSAEAGKMSVALAQPSRPRTRSNPTQGGGGVGSEGATHGLWSPGAGRRQQGGLCVRETGGEGLPHADGNNGADGHPGGTTEHFQCVCQCALAMHFGALSIRASSLPWSQHAERP